MSLPPSTEQGAAGRVDKYVLKLYVTGQSSRSERATANLRRICEEHLAGRCEMFVIDVLEQPQLAENEKILATPTLVRHSPPPLRRVIGDLSEMEKVLRGLDLPVAEAIANREERELPREDVHG